MYLIPFKSWQTQTHTKITFSGIIKFSRLINKKITPSSLWLLIIPIQITKTFTINMVIAAGPLPRHSCSVFITLLFPGLWHSTFCYNFWSFLFNLCIQHKIFFPCLFSAQFFQLYLFRRFYFFIFFFPTTAAVVSHQGLTISGDRASAKDGPHHHHHHHQSSSIIINHHHHHHWGPGLC